MKITEMIIMLSEQLKNHGDIEVVMQATVFQDGFSASGMKNIPDVFESTVESFTIEKETPKSGKRVRLWWQP